MTDFNRLDKNKILKDPSEICLFVATRNNETLMPAFFEHHRKIGVDRFFVIDNMSSDGTIDFLLKQENTHIFQTNAPYRVKQGKRSVNWNRWANELREYTMGNWCIVVDSDEFFIYTGYEDIGVKELVKHLDEEGSTGMRGYLIDMYSKCPVKDAIYKKGENIFDVLQYFDFPLDRKHNPRLRAMGNKKAIRLNKYPLFKCSKTSVIGAGHHDIYGCKVSSTVRGGVLHFKFTSDYVDHLKVESARGVYYGKSKIKRRMLKKLSGNGEFSFYGDMSLKYINSEQLVELGIMI